MFYKSLSPTKKSKQNPKNERLLIIPEQINQWKHLANNNATKGGRMRCTVPRVAYEISLCSCICFIIIYCRGIFFSSFFIHFRRYYKCTPKNKQVSIHTFDIGGVLFIMEEMSVSLKVFAKLDVI